MSQNDKNDRNDRNDEGELLFDFKKVMNYKRKVKIIVKEKNKPNIDRMARAFYDLLKK